MYEQKILNLTPQPEAVNKSWKNFSDNRSREWGLYGLDFGIHDFNLMLGGLSGGKLITIAGRSGMGKTATTTPMFAAAQNPTNEGKQANFLFFSWEMGPHSIVDRHISYETGLTIRMLTQGAKLLTDKHLDAIKTAYKNAQTLPVWYQTISTDINTVISVSEGFVKDCRERAKVTGVDILPVIIIDFLGMAQYEGDGLRTYGIGHFMNSLKQFLNRENACGVVFGQINRVADGKTLPDKADLADSQSIETASDSLVIIHRPEYNKVPSIIDPKTGLEVSSKNKLLARFVKGREYGVGDILLDCDIKCSRFKAQGHDWGFNYNDLYSQESFWKEHFGF